jgi:phytoene desaturase
VAKIVVIGAGFGGLAAAIRLQAAGHQVTLVEANGSPGGRAGRLEEAGFTFDMGPTIITAPHLLEDIWTVAGRSMRDDVDLFPLRPFYTLNFRDGSHFAYGKSTGAADGAAFDPDEVSRSMAAEVERINPADVDGYRRFMRDTSAIYQRAFEQLGRRPFLSVVDMLRVAPELARLGAHRSVYDFVSRYFRDEHLRTVFSFHPLFIGGSPFRASAIYSIVPYLEQTGGVWFARGGMSSLVTAMARLLDSLGGVLRFGDRVSEIMVRDGRATGVRLATGAEVAAEAVVSNADVANTYIDLVSPAHRRRNSDKRLRSFDYSMSCFLLYLGLDRTYPHLDHHTVLMPRRYREVVDAIFSGRLMEDDLAIYLHVPTRTDPSMAPPGGESMYALVPVPNLAGNLDWPSAGDRLRNRVMRILRDELNLADIERHIVVERRFTPLDFRDYHASHVGSAFSVSPTLLQSAYFRPHNRSEDLPGLYLVGAGTHPGAGIPGVLLSAEIAANLISADYRHPSSRPRSVAVPGGPAR